MKFKEFLEKPETGDIVESREDFDKSDIYKQFNTAMSEIYKFGDMWKTRELEAKLDRKEWNELRSLQFESTQNLAKLIDLLREISVK